MDRTKAEAETHFRLLVLSGIWMLARIIVNPKAAGSISVNWRASTIEYADDVGLQGEEAKEYRRTETYPIIQNDFTRRA